MIQRKIASYTIKVTTIERLTEHCERIGAKKSPVVDIAVNEYLDRQIRI